MYIVIIIIIILIFLILFSTNKKKEMMSLGALTQLVARDPQDSYEISNAYDYYPYYYSNMYPWYVPYYPIKKYLEMT